MSKTKFSKLWYLVGVLLLANLAVWTLLSQTRNTDFAKLYFFDVGQGDAIYLRTAEGNDVLIDGGPGDAVLSKLGRVLPFADRSIELMLLSHPHADHTSGLVEILKRYRIKQVLLSDVVYDSATFQTFRNLLEEKKVQVITPKLGQRIFLDRSTVLDIYYPVVGKFDPPPTDINDVSIVARLSFGKSNVLFTGDADRGIENLIQNLALPLSAEILKVGHQGSRTSTGPEFLKAVAPDYSIISVGKNSYGHPHPEVLGILQAQGLTPWRTDERGDAVFALYADRVEALSAVAPEVAP